MVHTKRQSTSKKWPIKRKGTKYVVTIRENKKRGVPLLLVMRELLGLGRTRKEVKKILNQKKVIVNYKVALDERSSLLLFDTIIFKDLGKTYRLLLSEKGKFMLEEIDEKEAKKKINKVRGKRRINNGKIQINLYDGRNIITNEKIKVGDSIILDLENKSIIKVMPLKEKSKVFIISGKHAGKRGEVQKIEGSRIEIRIGDKSLSIDKENLMVIE